MAGFGRSNSLSINTGGSLLFQAAFDTQLQRCLANTQISSTDHTSGSTGTGTTQPPPAGGLFGSTSATTQPTQAGFGSTMTTSQPAQQGGLFGSTAQSGGLFGAKPASAPPAGSLFGAPASSAPQQGGLFGSTAAAPAPAQQSGGLFGSLGQTQQQPQQQSTGGSLFPSLNQQPAQQPAGGSLFSNIGQPQPMSFGATQPQTQPGQQGGTFGLSIAGRAPNASLFNKQPTLPPLGLGQSTQSQQTVPGVRIDVSQLRGTTRFTDLHDDLQKDLCLIDDFIHKQMSYREQIDAVMPKTQEAVSSIAPDVELLNGKADTVELALENDVESIRVLRELVKQDVDDAKISFKSIENLKLPSQFHYQSGWLPASAAVALEDDDASGPVDIMQYFSQKAAALDTQLQKYLEQLAEIEGHLRTVEGSTIVQSEALASRRNGGDEDSVQGKLRNLAHTMGLFEEAIRNVASKVGGAREEVVELSSGSYNGASNGVNGNNAQGSPWQRNATAAPEPQRRRLGWS